MNIEQLKNLIKDLPNEMPVGLVDLSTDDYDKGNYRLTEKSFSVEDYVTEPDGKKKGKMFVISFKKK